MSDTLNTGGGQEGAEQDVQDFEDELGPFVVAAETTRMPMLFTNAKSAQNEIIYVNQSFLKLTGYDEAGALGMPFHCLLAKEADRVDVTLEVIASKESSSIDLCCLREDRTEFEAAVLASPVCNEAGELQQYFISLIDLTVYVQGRVEGHLREAEIYAHAPGFIAFTEGAKHRFAFANTAYETLVGRRDFVGQRVIDLLPELADQGIIDLLDKVFVDGKRRVGKSQPIFLRRDPTSDLEKRYIDYLYEPVRNASGAVIGVFCEGSDITDAQHTTERLNDTRSQLVQVSRTNAMGTMAATLAHEINQPLAAIVNYASGCASLFEQGRLDSEKLHEGLLAISAAADRAGKIIRHLREMTKRTAPAMEIFDLNVALEESVRLVRAGGCQDVSISVQCPHPLPVLGDKIQIEQVVINLLRNACHAAAQSGGEGAVLALTTMKDDRPCVVVRDNGTGIPANMENNVFEWQETTKSDGMGIGLSISRTIAEHHQGTICVDETGPLGTTFSFSLPGVQTDIAEIRGST